MYRSWKVPSPVVVTLLSPSPSASRRVQECFMQWTTTTAAQTEEKINSGFDGEQQKPHHQYDNYKGDALDQAFGKTFFTPPLQWDSVELDVSYGSQSTLLHLLAPKCSSSRFHHEKHYSLELLSIQQTSSVREARTMLSESLSETASHAKLMMQRLFLRKPIAARHLLGASALPLLQWSAEDINSSQPHDAVDGEEGLHSNRRRLQLKEVAIPAYFDATYDSRSNKDAPVESETLFAKLSQSPLERPVTGLYQYPRSNFCVRPLPSAKEDRHLPPPSLVFHVDCLDTTFQEPKKHNSGAGTISRIGFKGGRNMGQIMWRHAALNGLDVRFCEAKGRSSTFAEAHESLLAASLDELQSTDVLRHKDDQHSADDPRVLKADCWIEFRATLRNPAGYFSSEAARKRSSGSPLRIAKIPDLPYE